MGTGLNLPLYPAEVRLTGVDLSPAMLAIARDRARDLDRSVALRLADAHALPFPDEAFDTVVCTFSLCAIPDPHRAVGEMQRVLRPGGILLLADHVRAANPIARGVQRLMEVASVPLGGEHFRRRPIDDLRTRPFEIEQHERFTLGIVERLSARKA